MAAAVVADAPARRPMFQPAVAPDRKEIVFVSGGDLWTAPLDGGEARLLVSHPATESRPIYSPDGARLAFVSNRTGNGDIYVLTLATGDLVRITHGDTADQLDAWSHDGAWLYFSSNQHEVGGLSNVFRVGSTGGTPMPVIHERYISEYWAAPSPKGDAIALTAKGIVNNQWWRHGHSHIDESEIWVRTGDSYRQVTKGGAKSAWPMWSDNGGRLIYMSDRGGAENLWTQPPGGEPRQITKFTTGRVLWPSIAYDGKTVVFERDLGLWRLDVGSGKASPIDITLRGAPAGDGTQRLTLQNRFSDLALSPDGKKVAFIARGDVFAASSKEADPAERLTRTEAAEGAPAWAPDSRRVAYTSLRDGTYQIWMYDFASGKESALTTQASGSHSPRWSPDGKSLAFVRGRDGWWCSTWRRRSSVRSRRASSGCRRSIADARSRGRPTASGSRSTASVHGGSATCISCRAAGGSPRQVTFTASTSGDAITWAPDSTYLLFESTQRTEPGGIARVDLVKRTPKFREDRFRELFREEVPRTTPAAPPATTPGTPSTSPASPAPSTAPATAPTPPATDAATAPGGASKPPNATPPAVKIVWDDIRRRLSMLPVGVSVNEHVITPDGKTLVMAASAAGQTNLYAWSLDELSKEPEVARQITSTPGSKTDVQVSPDGKEVYLPRTGTHRVGRDRVAAGEAARRDGGDGRGLRPRQARGLPRGVDVPARLVLRPVVPRGQLGGAARDVCTVRGGQCHRR